MFTLRQCDAKKPLNRRSRQWTTNERQRKRTNGDDNIRFNWGNKGDESERKWSPEKCTNATLLSLITQWISRVRPIDRFACGSKKREHKTRTCDRLQSKHKTAKRNSFTCHSHASIRMSNSCQLFDGIHSSSKFVHSKIPFHFFAFDFLSLNSLSISQKPKARWFVLLSFLFYERHNKLSKRGENEFDRYATA